MSNILFHTVTFDYDNNFEELCYDTREYSKDCIVYRRLAKNLKKSIEYNYPNSKIDIREISPPNFKEFKGTNVEDFKATNTVKLEMWNEVVQNSDYNTNIVLLDCDTFIRYKFDEVFDNDFDVGFTHRNTNPVKFNGGVIFVKSNENSKKFFEEFVKINNEMLKNKSFHEKYKKIYDGMNQSAMGCLYERNLKNKIYNIKLFNCSKYNMHMSKFWTTQNNGKILHLKGELKYLLFNKNNLNKKHKYGKRLLNLHKPILNEYIKLIEEWLNFEGSTIIYNKSLMEDNVFIPEIKYNVFIPEIKYNENITKSKDIINITEIKKFVRNSISPNDWLELIKNFNKSTSRNKNFNEYILNIYKKILINKSIKSKV